MAKDSIITVPSGSTKAGTPYINNGIHDWD